MEKKKKKNKSNVENSVGYYDKTLLTEAKNDEAAVLVCTEPIVKVNTGEAPLKSFFVKEFQEGKEVVKNSKGEVIGVRYYHVILCHDAMGNSYTWNLRDIASVKLLDGKELSCGGVGTYYGALLSGARVMESIRRFYNSPEAALHKPHPVPTEFVVSMGQDEPPIRIKDFHFIKRADNFYEVEGTSNGKHIIKVVNEKLDHMETDTTGYYTFDEVVNTPEYAYLFLTYDNCKGIPAEGNCDKRVEAKDRLEGIVLTTNEDGLLITQEVVVSEFKEVHNDVHSLSGEFIRINYHHGADCFINRQNDVAFFQLKDFVSLSLLDGTELDTRTIGLSFGALIAGAKTMKEIKEIRNLPEANDFYSHFIPLEYEAYSLNSTKPEARIRDFHFEKTKDNDYVVKGLTDGISTTMTVDTELDCIRMDTGESFLFKEICEEPEYGYLFGGCGNSDCKIKNTICGMRNKKKELGSEKLIATIRSYTHPNFKTDKVVVTKFVEESTELIGSNKQHWHHGIHTYNEVSKETGHEDICDIVKLRLLDGVELFNNDIAANFSALLAGAKTMAEIGAMANAERNWFHLVPSEYVVCPTCSWIDGKVLSNFHFETMDDGSLRVYGYLDGKLTAAEVHKSEDYLIADTGEPMYFSDGILEDPDYAYLIQPYNERRFSFPVPMIERFSDNGDCEQADECVENETVSGDCEETEKCDKMKADDKVEANNGYPDDCEGDTEDNMWTVSVKGLEVEPDAPLMKMKKINRETLEAVFNVENNRYAAGFFPSKFLGTMLASPDFLFKAPIVMTSCGQILIGVDFFCKDNGKNPYVRGYCGEFEYNVPMADVQCVMFSDGTIIDGSQAMKIYPILLCGIRTKNAAFAFAHGIEYSEKFCDGSEKR